MRTRTDFDQEYPLFSHIQATARGFDWLISAGMTVGSVANFGCATGMETLALIHAFGATEAVGVDIDDDCIVQARETLDSLKCAAVGIAHQVAYYGEYREWWGQLVPDFIKGLVLNSIPDGLVPGVRETTIAFMRADITSELCIAAGHFDLVYCDHVLYHVLCDHGERALEKAVNEMARAAAPGGCVVAVEPSSCSPEHPQPLNFARFFERAGLEPCRPRRESVSPAEELRAYCYRKPTPPAGSPLHTRPARTAPTPYTP